MVKVLHLSDIHLGSNLNQGRINPVTGLNTRLEDFAKTLEHCIDYALEQKVELVLFGGDAFPDATPPPLHQELFARQFFRLSEAGIPTVLLVGNHDQYGQGQEGSSLSLYRTLGVRGVVVGDRLQTHRLQTQSGAVQVTTLPWLNRSVLLTRQDCEGLSAEGIDRLLLQRLHLALEGEIRQLDPTIPAVLLVHAMVDTARYGAERHLAVGKGFTVPLALIARPAYQYVALGHVHRHQVLCRDPWVVYPGSLERVDFGEEQETKGFVIADVQIQGSTMEFVPVAARTFRTLRLDLTDLGVGSGGLQTRILNEIARAPIAGSIVRVMIRIRPDQLLELDEAALFRALEPAFSFTLIPEVVGIGRTRLPGLDTHQWDPIQALEHYLITREDLVSVHSHLLEAARRLLADEWVDPDPLDLQDRGVEAEAPLGDQQLRLL